MELQAAQTNAPHSNTRSLSTHLPEDVRALTLPSHGALTQMSVGISGPMAQASGTLAITIIELAATTASHRPVVLLARRSATLRPVAIRHGPCTRRDERGVP